VWERVAPQVGQRRRRAAVIGVTVTAGQRGTLLRDQAMQFCHIKHLCGDIGMTGRTTVRHVRRFPRRGVTGLAILANLCVGSYTSERFACLRVESPGAI
jgi:hypothetical protein